MQATLIMGHTPTKVARFLRRRLAVLALVLAVVGAIGAMQTGRAEAATGFELNGGYSQNLYGHDSFGHELDRLAWHMGSKNFIAGKILSNSEHQMSNGKWMLAEEYMSFTQSVQKYCVKVWYSAWPGQDYRFDQIGSTYWNCLAH